MYIDPRDPSKTNALLSHIIKYGSKMKDRKCYFDQDGLCDMLCSSFKIQIITQDIERKSFHALCFCTKFEPPIELEILTLPPWAKEEGEG